VGVVSRDRDPTTARTSMLVWQGQRDGFACVAGDPLIIFVVAAWGLLIGGIVYLVRYLVLRTVRSSSQTSASDRETPLDILKQRYARGEITAEQYQQMKRTLES
jgi:putative membrane protein